MNKALRIFNGLAAMIKSSTVDVYDTTTLWWAARRIPDRAVLMCWWSRVAASPRA